MGIARKKSHQNLPVRVKGRLADSAPHIALLVETSREYARGLLRGIARYHQEFGPWSIYFATRGLREQPPKWLRDWHGDGILVRLNDQKMADAILASGIPAVDVRGALPDVGLPFIGVDNRPVAALAFEHLRSCGLTNFGFCGTPRDVNPNQNLRCDYFVELVESNGFRCDVNLGIESKTGRLNWEAEQQTIAKWLESLPKPVGIMTCHDDRGQQVLDACRRAGFRVPDEVAVVSVDNDVHMCNLSTPPLTSIDVNPGRIGFEAAALLARAMNGEKLSSEPILLGPPRGLVPRQSTNLVRFDDADVESAVRHIREKACSGGLRVRDIVAMAKRSPTTFERRFKSSVGRTIKAEINRVRLGSAKLLLAETDLSISRIADRCGFGETKYFCEAFRNFEGVTASEYRQSFRLDR
jgi:LacI family transcriptional regulator